MKMSAKNERILDLVNDAKRNAICIIDTNADQNTIAGLIAELFNTLESDILDVIRPTKKPIPKWGRVTQSD